MELFQTLPILGFLSLTPLSFAAVTYWSNYQPSLEAPVQTGDGWRRSTTTLDAGSLATLGPGDKYSGWYFQNNALVRQGFTTEFTVTKEFTATHMTIPVRASGNLNGTYIDIHIDRFENGNFVQETRSFIRPGQLPSTVGQYLDYTVEFGSNNSDQPDLFQETPLTLVPGELYRFRVGGNNGGGVGGISLRDSQVSGPATNTVATASNATPLADVTFQPAFAFNDGANSLIPEPSVALLSLLGLPALLRRKRVN